MKQSIDLLIERTRHVDILSDCHTEPEAVFAVLGQDLLSVTNYDADRIRTARLSSQGARAAAGQAFFDAFGWDAITLQAQGEIRAAIADLTTRERFASWGLFVEPESREGIALGLSLAIKGSTIDLYDQAGAETRKQAKIACDLQRVAGAAIDIEWPADLGGESIGVPITIALLTEGGMIPRDGLLASTGRLDVAGNVLPVANVTAKIQAAIRLGMRRVVVPREDAKEAAAVAGEALTVVPVGHVNELAPALRQTTTAVELDFAALTRLVRASARDYGLVVAEEREHPHGRCFVMSNTGGKVNLWVYENGRVMPQGGVGTALDAARKLIKERVPLDPEPRPNKTIQIPTRDFQLEARRVLAMAGAVELQANTHEAWRMQLRRGRSNATAILYESGKCVLQGSAPAWQTALDSLSASLASIGGVPPETNDASNAAGAIAALDSSAPHIGTDEAGKGDYFGPLVCAAVYVDGLLAETLREIGVRDSKALSDKRVRALAERIRVLAEGRFAVTPIYPKKYNELQLQFAKEGKNLNSMLAWGHAKSIDRLLSAPAGRGIQPTFVLVDQFAEARVVEDRTRRVRVPVYQRPKAEDDIAVAAASILARDAFLNWLEKWSSRTGTSLPKGASEQVILAAKAIRRRWGMQALNELAKVSFRTTKQVLEGEDGNAPTEPPPWSDSEYAVES